MIEARRTGQPDHAPRVHHLCQVCPASSEAMDANLPDREPWAPSKHGHGIRVRAERRAFVRVPLTTVDEKRKRELGRQLDLGLKCRQLRWPRAHTVRPRCSHSAAPLQVATMGYSLPGLKFPIYLFSPETGPHEATSLHLAPTPHPTPRGGSTTPTRMLGSRIYGLGPIDGHIGP
jgi:hypothetical protein